MYISYHMEYRVVNWRRNMGTKCCKCGQVVSLGGRGIHRKMCTRIPTPQELIKMLEDEPELSINKLAQRYGTVRRRLVKRLKLGGWTSEDVRLRSRHPTRRKAPRLYRPRCYRCGLVVDNPGLCCWCEYENQGVRNYHDLYQI